MPTIENWREELRKRSGNLTTNQAMPEHLINNLLQENLSLKGKLTFQDVNFPELEGTLAEIKGLNILAGLQKFNKKDCLTLFRAIRFPTYKRIHEVVYKNGYSVLNYEQERILDLYNNADYISKRTQIEQDLLFWTQPQERVVKGLPIFCLVNDSLQIHRAFRSVKDKVIIIAIHILYELLETNRIKLISNPAIDLDYDNNQRDFEIKDFIKTNATYEIDFKALRARGIDLHEIYTSDLPSNVIGAEALGITQDFFLIDIYKITDNSKLDKLRVNTKILKYNSYFLHGIFGDQNIFGRKEVEYLPSRCQVIKKNES